MLLCDSLDRSEDEQHPYTKYSYALYTSEARRLGQHALIVSAVNALWQTNASPDDGDAVRDSTPASDFLSHVLVRPWGKGRMKGQERDH